MRTRLTMASVALAFALGSLALPAAATAQAVPSADAAGSAVNANAPADAPAPTSAAAAEVTKWAVASGDNSGLPFMVIDKVAAEVSLFDARGQFIGATPALLGMTPGDESAPGVGDRELSAIKPEDRTTPAGRFVAKFGAASGNRKVLWVDYATAISLHAVVTSNKKEHRLQRLKSVTPEDNRITFGCINIPAAFYAKVVQPLFTKTSGVVYILPETKPLNQVFLAFQAQGQPRPF